jgi:hypothetical protein
MHEHPPQKGGEHRPHGKQARTGGRKLLDKVFWYPHFFYQIKRGKSSRKNVSLYVFTVK